MTTPSRASWRKASRGRNSSSNSRWTTWRRRRTCSGRFMTEPAALTVGFRWKSRLCWRMTRDRRAEAKDLHTQARRPNVYIKIPGTPEGLPAIEEAIFAGVPINVTLLFSDDQYLAAANAFMRGIERRIEAARTRAGSFRSTSQQTNSATASLLQWVCRGCPWLVIGA